MRSAFKRYKLLKLAMGEEKMPEEGDARDRWIEKSAVLYDLILQSVNNDMFQHIKDLVELDDSEPKAWKLLRDVIQPNTLPMVIVLEKELAVLSMRPSDDVKPVLDKIKDTYARMAAAGSNVSQMQQCTKIISVLDNSWDNLIPTLNTQQDQWTPEWLRQQILQEDFRRRHTGGGAANKTAEGYGAAEGSRGRGGGRGQGCGRGFGRGRGRGDYNKGHGSSGGRGSTRMEGACWYCKKAGHPWFKCFSRPEGWAPPGMKLPRGERAQGGAVQGCTSHMTRRVDLLDEVKPPGKIKFVAAASGALLPVIGVGNAKVMGANEELMGEEKMLEEEDARDRWIEKSAVLYDLILQSINNDMFQHIKDLVELDDSGPKAWKLLRNVIPPNTLPMVILLEKELAALSMRSGNDVKPVLDKIKDTYARMAAAGSNVSQMQQCTKIISVLDNSWNNLIPTLNTQQDQWTPEWLRQEDFRRRHTGGGAANKTAEGYGAAGGSCTSHMTPRADFLDEVKPPGKIKFVAAASGALLPVIGVGNAKVMGANGGLVGLGNVLLVEGLSANLLSVRRLQKSKAKVTLGPNSCRAKLGKLLLWDLEEKSSCIKDLWQLPIIPWNGKPPATAKATTGGQETAPTDGALDAVKKNGVAECFNRNLQEGARTLLGCEGLPDPFWVTSLRQVALVKNRVLATVGDKQWVPYTKWYGSAPAVNMLRAYGCMVVFHVPKEKRGKLEASGRWGVHLGLAKDHKGWLIWDLTSQQLTVSRDVNFLESLYYKEWKQQQQKLPTTPLILEADEVQRPSRQVQVTVSDKEISGVTEDGGEPEVEEQQQQQKQHQDASPRAQHPLDRPRRDVRPPNRLTYPSFGKPKVWKQSVKEEYDSLLENETWELCELPPGKKAISSKLIFRHKYGPDGELTRYKSRLVAKGFQQTKGKDFDEIFAPVGKGTTLRVMLGTAANRGWRIKQMDITTAFLNGIILEELYMLQPEGLDDGSGRVCRLKKAIYGLKQAPRAWYHKLEETLLAGGFKKSECDHSLFLLQEKEQFLMLLCSKMGDVKYYLGMHVERDLDKGVLRLHQRRYCEGLAEKYGLQDGGKPATPLPSGFTVEPCADEEVAGESDRKLFHSMVGALNYAANHTRPDIAFATSRLASVVSRPSHEQLEAAKSLVRYVSAIASVGLEYSAVRQRLQRGAADLSKGEMLLTCYTDASFNNVKADGTSIGGYVCLLGGGAVSWRSKKQNEVVLSSCETEYMALHHGAKEVVWLRRLLEEIGVC
ncbi:unnamed protein product [Closterium sp. NIES-54]